MRRPFLALMALLLMSTSKVRAEAPASPLGLVPKNTEFLLHFAEPKNAFDAVYNHDLFAEWRKIQVVQDYYETTKVRRFFQLVSYFEKELGHERMELMDKLTGGGVVLTARATEPSGLMIVKAKDAELLQRFFSLARRVLEQELARQDGTGLLKERDYHGVKTLELDKFHVAISGAYLVGATDRKVFEQSLDLCLGKGDSVLDNPRFKEATKEKPGSALAWGWMDWQEIKKIPQVKSGLDPLGGDPVSFLIFGGVADVVRRSPWIAAALTEEKQNFRFSLTMPRGRDGMPAIGAAIVPPGDKSSLPLLKPPRTITSTSYYLDVAHFWDNKAKFLSKDDLKELEKGEKFIAPFLGGKTLADVFPKLGPYQRFVTTQPSTITASTDKVSIAGTSFGLVLDLRDPTFGKNLDKILRAGGLAATFQFGLRMKEEEYHGHKMVIYHVNEKTKLPDVSLKGLSPCFAQVGNQFMVSSTVELGRDLIDMLDKEDRTALHSASSRSQLYAAGLADNIKSVEDTLVTQLVLNQGLSISAARNEMKTLVELVRRLGEGEAAIHYGRNNFRLDAVWRFKE